MCEFSVPWMGKGIHSRTGHKIAIMMSKGTLMIRILLLALS